MKGVWKLKLRLWLTMVLMFALVWVILAIAGSLLGIGGSISFYLILTIIIALAQYLLGPKIVNSTMHVREVSPQEAPHLHKMVEELALEAGIPKPKVGISDYTVPNAFAYGRTKRSGHVCVTRGILGLLSRDELKAVLGHEMGHIKHNDMIITTIVSVIPMICYYVAWSTIFSRGSNDNGGALLIGAIAFAAYFISQLLVLLVSRIREYYADAASVEFGSRPEHLASALYKLSYGAATANEEEIKDMNSNRAFFASDIKNGSNDIHSFRQLDYDNDGMISAEELQRLRNSNVHVSTSDKLMELLSTHPDMLKRVKKLSELEN